MHGEEPSKLVHRALTEDIIGAAIEVHRELGAGIFEHPYELALAHELHLRGTPCRAQVELPIEYKGLRIENAYRVDLIVNEAVIVEIKAVEKLLPVHEAQVLTYMRLSRIKLGLLMNFHAPLLKDGLKRFVL